MFFKSSKHKRSSSKHYRSSGGGEHEHEHEHEHEDDAYSSNRSPDYGSGYGKHSSYETTPFYGKQKKIKEPAYKKNEYQTVVLKVEFYSDGCIRKVRMALAEIDGVDTIAMDAKRMKVTVTGYVDPNQVLKKVAKTGKLAEIVSSGDSRYASSYEQKTEKSYEQKHRNHDSSSYNMYDSNNRYENSSSSGYGDTPSFNESRLESSRFEKSNVRRNDIPSFNESRLIVPSIEEDPNACCIM